MNVLIIDDDLEDRESIGDIFKKHFPDFGVITNSGSGFIDILKNKKPGLVVLSLNIEGQDGIKVIRDIYDRCDVPIIALSSKGNIEVVAALENGAVSCINKPINQRIFVARIWVLFRGGNHD
jgi:DNA-binding response OmpR family regulator